MSRQPSDEHDRNQGESDTPDAGEAASAALDAVEPERLLAGEHEDTPHVDDAIHWTRVYAELVDFKRSLLTVTEQRVSSMEAAARAEVKATDLEVLQAEAQRLERRLDFWRIRSTVLRERPGKPRG